MISIHGIIYHTSHGHVFLSSSRYAWLCKSSSYGPTNSLDNNGSIDFNIQSMYNIQIWSIVAENKICQTACSSVLNISFVILSLIHL